MTVIKGEKIQDTAILTQTKELFFPESSTASVSFFEEECQKSFQKGEEKGVSKGYERGVNETKPLFELLQTVAQKLFEQKKALFEQLKPEVIELAIALSERVIRKELSQPEQMVRLINSLLQASTTHFHHEPVQIVLSPEDLVMLEQHLAKIQYDRRAIVGLSFRADAWLKRGDCRIEAQSALLNYSISRELSNLQAKILQC